MEPPTPKDGTDTADGGTVAEAEKVIAEPDTEEAQASREGCCR